MAEEKKKGKKKKKKGKRRFSDCTCAGEAWPWNIAHRASTAKFRGKVQEESTDKAKPSKTHAKHKQPKRKTNAPPPPQRSGPDHHSNTVRPEGVKRANVGLQAQISMRHLWARRRTRHATFVERHMLLSDMGDRKQRGMRRKWSKPSQNNRCQHQRRLDADDAEGLRGKPPKKKTTPGKRAG